MPIPVPIFNALFLNLREEPGWRVTANKMLRKIHESREDDELQFCTLHIIVLEMTAS
jgi:hypothetical protein